MKDLMQWYKEQKKLHRKCAYQILVQVKEVLAKLPTLVETTLKETEKLTVCGDTHGQYYDLLNIFELNGLPSESNPYIFNGDFVDRGSFSVEVILTLFGFKLLYPDHFHLLRGNGATAGAGCNGAGCGVTLSSPGCGVLSPHPGIGSHAWGHKAVCPALGCSDGFWGLVACPGFWGLVPCPWLWGWVIP
eukprot:XP_027303071.1 serine/threonine-protein phosphatase 5-like [Anas platyrhynchos]